MMRSLLSVSIPLLFFLSPSLAALATNAPPAVSFFRSKLSLFPSGQASRNNLENGLIRVDSEISLRTKWDEKEYSLQDSEVLRDIHVAHFVETQNRSPIYQTPKDSSLPTTYVDEKSQLEILEIQDAWAKVKQQSGQFVGWIQLQHLRTRPEDLGYFINLADTFLHVAPQETSPVLTTIPRLRRFIPLEIKDSYLKIQFGNQIGFTHITNFISRADFAQLAYHPVKNWIKVSYKNNNKIFTETGDFVLIKEILGYVTLSSRGIIKKCESESNPPIRARVEILKQESSLWGLSRLEGHGEVWWKKKELLSEEKQNKSDTTITTEELLKREIYSIAFENKKSLRGLLSSEGVYLTEDGLNWSKIPQFGNLNFPVSIHPDGTWFVGPYKSINHGKSFEPFIKWDHVAKIIESSYHRNPKYLKLVQIDSLNNSRIQIHVDTGVSKVILRTSLNDVDWKIITK